MRLAPLVFAFVGFAPLSTQAEEPSAPALAWHAPDDCPDAAQVRKSIEHWLGQSVEPVDARALVVEATVYRSGEHFTLELSLESPSGRGVQQFTARSCASLADVVALKVALAASLSAALETHDAPAQDALEFGAVRALGGATLGVLPGLSSSFELAGALGFSSARLELGMSYAPPRTARYVDPHDVGAKLQLLSATSRGCVRIDLRRAEALLCAGVQLGRMRGAGFGTERSRTSNQLFGAIVLAPALRWPLTRRLLAWLEIDVLFAFLRPSYQVRSLPRLYRPNAVAGQVNLGMEWEFW